MQAHPEAGSFSPNSMAFDSSAQERCPLQLGPLSPSWFCPPEKAVAATEVTVLAWSATGKQPRASPLEAFSTRTSWKWAAG